MEFILEKCVPIHLQVKMFCLASIDNQNLINKHSLVFGYDY